MLIVNSYFNDNVKSIAFQGEELPTTVGVISPGNYAFGTSENETLTIISGTLKVQLPETEAWVDYTSGEVFKVAAHQTFHVTATTDTAYLCTYATQTI
jgi:uncharacterized protein YaiE (UPF0345 family)